MDRETAKQTIRENWREILNQITEPAKQKVNGEISYICPLCSHGTNGDGLTFNPKSKDKNSLKCFSCGFSGDIIDLYREIYETSYNETLFLLADMIGITIDDKSLTDLPQKSPQSHETTNKQPNQPENKKTAQNANAQENKPMADYTEYYKACKLLIDRPEAVSYLNGRGISLATAKKYGLGFDYAADPANAPGEINGAAYKPYPTPRIIIATSKSHYFGRRIDGQKKAKAMNADNSTPGIFNFKAIAQSKEPVFICEGAFDALSVAEAGGTAIAINSANNADKFNTILETRRNEKREIPKHFILCLDKDKSGKTARDKIAKKLRQLKISFADADICGGNKDPNEALTADRNSFLSVVKKTIRQYSKPDNTKDYIDFLMPDEMREFENPVKTGFANLDKAIEGGLYPGFYILAAISSLGKTTFALQMADQIAAAGNDVLFFSLEQSRLEMVSKSLARMAAQNSNFEAPSSLEVRKGKAPELTQMAANQYKKHIGDRLSIIEADFDCNVMTICNYVKQYCQKNENKPIVFIDYLQMLRPPKTAKGGGTQEAITETIRALINLKRELNIVLFAISSINRQNYLTSMDFESLKHAGEIEFSADAVWGLQFQCIEANKTLFDGDPKKNIEKKRDAIKTAKTETPRRIDLLSLKGRSIDPIFHCYFNYYPRNDLFMIDNEPKIEQMADTAEINNKKRRRL